MSLDEIITAVKQTEERLATAAKAIDGLRTLLRKSRDQLTKSNWPLETLEHLQGALKAPRELSPDVDVGHLADLAGSVLDSLSRDFAQHFRKELASEADKAGVSFGIMGDDLTMGPFTLTLDRPRKSATLVYAKAPFCIGLPLDAEKIVTAAKQLAAGLLAPPEDIGKLSAEFEEAILVALTRERKSLRQAELRAELPAVYREMTFVRQSGKRAGAQKTNAEYSLARFVVEVGSLVRSDANISSDKPFRLEAAVIENTGNPRKSVFIPRELTKGYGEGMYYQAIVLRQAS